MITGITTQVPSCGYDQVFAVSAAPAINLPSTFYMSTTTTNIIIDLYSRNLVDVGKHTITLTSTLKDYNPYTGATVPTASKAFILTAVNPCLSTVIESSPV